MTRSDLFTREQARRAEALDLAIKATGLVMAPEPFTAAVATALEVHLVTLAERLAHWIEDGEHKALAALERVEPAGVA